MGIRIVSDSSSDCGEMAGFDYVTVPLKIMFASHEYVDEPGIDCEKMMSDLYAHRGPSTTSCPNVHDWLQAFEGSDEVFGVTISSGLSASYESAIMAAQQHRSVNPGARVHIFDSHATGPVLRLIIEKLCEQIEAGKSYSEIKLKTIQYQKRIRILYSLESLENLARNGRVNTHVARFAKALNIRVVGHASDEGTVELLHKCRGDNRALKAIVEEMTNRGYASGKVHIDHCLNAVSAAKLKGMIEEAFPLAQVEIHPCGALCSYYADKGGLIVGYEVD